MRQAPNGDTSHIPQPSTRRGLAHPGLASLPRGSRPRRAQPDRAHPIIAQDGQGTACAPRRLKPPHWSRPVCTSLPGVSLPWERRSGHTTPSGVCTTSACQTGKPSDKEAIQVALRESALTMIANLWRARNRPRASMLKSLHTEATRLAPCKTGSKPCPLTRLLRARPDPLPAPRDFLAYETSLGAGRSGWLVLPDR